MFRRGTEGSDVEGADHPLQVRARSRGIRSPYIVGTTLKANEVSAAIYRDFLPDALAEGRYIAAPKPAAVGHGVQDFQQAMDIQLKRISAAKIAVTLPQRPGPPARGTPGGPHQAASGDPDAGSLTR